MDNKDTSLKKKHTILYIFIGIALVALIAAGSILLLRSIMPIKNTTSPTHFTSAGSAEVLRQYSVYVSGNSELSKTYTSPTLLSTTTLLPHTFKSYPYAISIPADSAVQLTQKDKAVLSNPASVTTTIDKYLISQHLNEVNTQSTLGVVIYQEFESDTVYCQLLNYPVIHTTPARYVLVCVDKSVAQKYYSSIDTLLALYRKQNSLPSFTSISRTDVTSGTKSLSMLTIGGLHATPSSEILVFAALNGDWEYLGSRPVPSIDVKDSYTIPDTLKKAISDPKWGTFLTNNVH